MAHAGYPPRDAGGRTGPKRRIAKRFAWLQATIRNRPEYGTAEAQRLLRRIQAELVALPVVLQREQAAAQVSQSFSRRHGVDDLRHLPRAQECLGEGESHCGSSPFPWFVNVGHACYLDSVVTCLFHCAVPRQYMRTMARTSELREALQDFLRDYTDGIILGPAETTPWHWDVLAPCRLVDAVAEASRTMIGQDVFEFGPQHDA